MKWRVMEHRLKRREALYHRFMARYFTVKNARKYFDYLADSKEAMPRYDADNGRGLLRKYLHGVLVEHHQIDLDRMKERSGRLHTSKYGNIWCDHGYKYRARQWGDDDCEFYWSQYELTEDERNHYIDKQGDTEKEVNKLLYTDYITMPASFTIKDSRYGPTINERVYLVRRSKESLKAYNTLMALQKNAEDVCSLLREIRARVHPTARGRKKLMQVIAPELLADFKPNGQYDFEKLLGDYR